VIKLVKQTAYLALVVMFCAKAMAVTPSPAMIEQFKQLPKSEQLKLAKQYGIDLNQLNLDNNQKKIKTEAMPLAPKEQFPEEEIDKKTEIKLVDDGQPKRFGMELFNAKISTFAPIDNAPVPENYRLGPDDNLILQLYGKENSTEELTIGRDGQVQITNVGPVAVAGLTYTEASNLIKSKIEESNIGLQASISMGALRTINIFIAGEAKYPGMYAVSAMTTVTQALFVAGGISEIGSLRDIRIQRNGQAVGQFDLYQLLLNGDNSGDLNLRHGDVVFIAPVQSLVEIAGEVNRPAIYEIVPGETVQQLLKMAGGNKATAHLQGAVLERVNQQGLKTLTNLDLTAGNSISTVLRNGDFLRLASVSNRVENEVVLAGAVVRPGRYAYQPGMQLKDLISGVWTDLLPTVDLDYALILREKNSRGDIEVIQLNLVDALGLNGRFSSQSTINLQPRDIVVAFQTAIEKNDEKDVAEQAEKEKRFKQQFNIDVVKAMTAEEAMTNVIEPEKKQKLQLASAKHFEFDSQLMTAEQEKALRSYLVRNYKSVFSEAVLLQQTPLLNRENMLIPIVEKLKQQSTNATPLAIASIFGDVKVPGDYPISDKSTATDLIIAAGGLKDSAYLQRAELSRYQGQSVNNDSTMVQNININLYEVLNEPDKNIRLQSRDRLNVFSMPDWSVNRTVEIAGEVKFPGTYQVTKGETISQLIERAGGFTDNAFAFGAVFTRDKVQKREQEQFDRLLMQLKSDIASKSLASDEGNNSSPEQSVALINQLAEQKMVGRLVLDMSQIQAGNPEYDLEVEEGDKLIIPKRNSVISVVGEVQNPGSHSFNAKLNVKNYLALSGNSRKRADEDRVYVLRADGSVIIPSNNWFGSGEQLMPGDTIVVPLDTEYKDKLTLWSQITQVFYQSAIAIAAINNVLNQ
jgi:polysaccharide export outer membrane protein